MIGKILKNRITGIALVVLMAASMVACGSEAASSNAEETITGNVTTASSESPTNVVEDGVIEETGIEEVREPEYEEYDSYYENVNFEWGGDLILDYQSTDPQDYQVEFEDVDGWPPYVIYDGIDLYAENGKVIGYTKDEAICQLCATSKDGWGVIIIDDRTKYIKMEDFDGNSALLTETDENGYVIPPKGSATASGTTSTSNDVASNDTGTSMVASSSDTSNTTTNEVSPNVSNATTTTSEVETQVVVDSGKYTPEEAVAVWRGILEANGMTWDPSIKDWASWGTGWLELKKGKPEEAAQMDLEGYAYGDGGGHPKTKYYIEVTGYDDNKVYMTSWSCS